MKIFKKDGLPQPTKLEKRISGIGTTELITWAENSLAVIGKGVYHHRRDSIEALLDAELGAEALLAIIRELKKRMI
jgi:hypothetical protein